MFAITSIIQQPQRISSNKKCFFMNKMRTGRPWTKKEYLQLSAVEFSRKYFPSWTEFFRDLLKYTLLKKWGTGSNENRTTFRFSFRSNCLKAFRVVNWKLWKQVVFKRTDGLLWLAIVYFEKSVNVWTVTFLKISKHVLSAWKLDVS